MKNLRILTFTVIALLLSTGARAQHVSISTNAMDWASLLTANAEVNVAVSRHITLDAGVKYNPWSFNKGSLTKEIHIKQRTVYGGVRYWPWHVFSGWWLSPGFQWKEYNFLAPGGNPFMEKQPDGSMKQIKLGPCEGDAFGANLSFGYSWIITKQINLEFGWGLYTGYATTTAYRMGIDSPWGGRQYELPHKGTVFVAPNQINLSIVFLL